VGEKVEPVRVRSVGALSRLNGLNKRIKISRERLRAASRWSPIVNPSDSDCGGEIELGELFRVHRGQVTGANAIWIAGTHADKLPERVKIPSVTKANDLIKAGARFTQQQSCAASLTCLLNWTSSAKEEGRGINAFLAWAKTQGARSRLHRAASKSVVVSGPESPRADPLHIHGAAAAAILPSMPATRDTSTLHMDYIRGHRCPWVH